MFTGHHFWDFYEDWCIFIKYISVAHPRANVQVKRANGMILDALKKRLYLKEEKHLDRWLKELPAVVWGLHTQASRSTGVSPYFLVYGSEATLPADIAFRAPRMENYDEEQAATVWTEDVDRAEEECLITWVRTAKYLEGLRRYYNCNIKGHSFAVGDLVLHRKQKTKGMNKLPFPWEGPYVVKEVTRPRSYHLYDLDGIDVPNSWHIAPHTFLSLKRSRYVLSTL
jgi:hypothetical protein